MPCYKCPYSNTEFTTTCPVKNCHANISSHESGCFFNLIKKESYGVSEIAYSQGISYKQAKINVDKGINKIKATLDLKYILEKINLRSVSQCPTCKVVRATGRCSSRKICLKRQEWTASVFSQIPEDMMEILNIKQSDIWKLMQLKSITKDCDVAAALQLTAQHKEEFNLLTKGIKI